MANRVLVLEVADLGTWEEYHLVVFYPINPPISVNGIVVVPTPSDTLPTPCAEYNLVPQAYKNQLDAGTLIFENRILRKKEGMTEAELLQLVQSKYAQSAVAAISALRAVYARMGVWAVDI